MAITGPSGSGKTLSALKLAAGLGKKIAVIDTENGSASLYSDHAGFDVLELAPPFTTERYIEAIEAAEKSGYDVLVIDSITHAWAGEGGLLEQKEQLDARGKGNSYTNWGLITKKHEAFKSAMLHSPLHIIATMRSKQDYMLVDKNGKQVPQKVGMAPIQRDGMEYEFTLVFDVAMNHEAEASKDRTGLFAGSIHKISEETGRRIAQWLSSAAATTQETTQAAGHPATEGPKIHGSLPESGALNNKSIATQPPVKPNPKNSALETEITEADLDVLNEVQQSRPMWKGSLITSYMQTRFGKTRLSLLSRQEFNELVGTIRTFTPTQAIEKLDREGNGAEQQKQETMRM